MSFLLGQKKNKKTKTKKVIIPTQYAKKSTLTDEEETKEAYQDQIELRKEKAQVDNLSEGDEVPSKEHSGEPNLIAQKYHEKYTHDGETYL